jgi:plastocyanin
LYRFWVFVHIVGLLGFLAAHGVSMAVLFLLRRERDPARIAHLLALSGSSIRPFYVSLGVLLLGGVVAGFMGDWWGYAWIWGAIVLLVGSSIVMWVVARPYYRRVGLLARAMASGSHAVSTEQLDEVLMGPRPFTLAGVGFGAILLILYLMMFKPSLGFSTGGEAPPAPGPGAVAISATELEFDASSLTAPAGEPFDLTFDNTVAVPHNVAIYTDDSAADPLFVGETVTGPTTITYAVPALDPGEYFFRCDVHPTQMTGTLVAEGGGTGA